MFAQGKTDSQQEGAMSAQFSNIGFTVSRRRQRRSVVVAQLIATVALIISIAVVVTAVSIGFANAGASTPTFGSQRASVVVGGPALESGDLRSR
jgi:hypothetical protein